jgi:hypothetical protein
MGKKLFPLYITGLNFPAFFPDRSRFSKQSTSASPLSTSIEAFVLVLLLWASE